MKVDIHDHFTKVPQGLLADRRLSMAAKGLFCWMLSCSESWNFSVHGMAHTFKEGECSIRNAVHELEKYGYLERKFRRENGRIAGYDYILHPVPLSGEDAEDAPQEDCHSAETPCEEIPVVEKTDCRKTADGDTACGKIEDFGGKSSPSPPAVFPYAGFQPTGFPSEENRTQTYIKPTENQEKKIQDNHIEYKGGTPPRVEYG